MKNRLTASQLALGNLEVLDTAAESQFDDLARLAAEICRTQTALIALLDGTRLWVKAKVGFEGSELPLENSFCRLTLEASGLQVFENASEDARVKDLPCVTGDTKLRFYAGAPLTDKDGVSIGTLCVMDTEAKTLDSFQRSALATLARQVVITLEQRAQAIYLTQLESTRERERESRAFKMIFDNLPVGLIRVFSQSGRVETANKAFRNLVGYDEAELANLTVHDLTVEDDRAQNIANLTKHAAARTGFTIEKRYLRKDGETIWVRVKANPIKETQDAFSCVVFDISEEKKAIEAREEAFRRVTASEQQLDVATRSAWVGVWEWNVADGKVRMSSIGRDLLGLPAGDQPLSFADFEACVHPEDREPLAQTLERVFRGEIEYNTEFRIVRQGEIRWVSGRGKVFRDAKGNPVKLVGANGDITDIRRDALEKEQLRLSELAARSASQIKTEFLANMSHEIRTPLNGVIGLTDLLLETPLAEDQLHFMRAVKQSSSVLLALINDILDFTKIEAGKLDLDPKVFSLGELMRQTEQCFQPLAAEKALAFNLHLKLSQGDRFVGDATRVQQILNNLVGNALKFTKRGQIDLSVEEGPLEDNKRRLTFKVKDTGIGIPANAMPKMFKSFSQADASTAREFGGSGLGLAICRRLIQLMDGEITVESHEGEGSEFKFQILLAPLMATLPPPAKPKAKAVDVDPGLVAKRGQYRILIAEDNTVNQEVALRFLLKAGFRVDVVSNGEEAVRAVANAAYDMVLMDCQMPVKDGYQATGELRALGQTLPIVALTANAFTTDRERCLSAGMVDYLTKPIRNDILVGTVDRWLKLG